jgi:peroxiredoxin
MSDVDLPVVGEPAPAFSLPASVGEHANLGDYFGKQHVLLAFYVLDFTGG